MTLWQRYYQVLTQRKSIWRKDLITYNSHLWIMFSFIFLVMIWKRGNLFDHGGLRSRGWTNFERKWTSGKGSVSWKLDNFHERHICIVICNPSRCSYILFLIKKRGNFLKKCQHNLTVYGTFNWFHCTYNMFCNSISTFEKFFFLW